MHFPDGSEPHLHFGEAALHPAQLYNAAAGLFVFAVVMLGARYLKAPGQRWWLFLGLYSVIRAAIDPTRYYEESAILIRMSGFVLTESQAIGIGIGVVSAIAFVWLRAAPRPSHGRGGVNARPTPNRYAVLGHPIAHSRSPELMRAAFASLGVEATYEALDVDPLHSASTIAGLHEAGVQGLNVTTPFKGVAFESAVRHEVPALQSEASNCLRWEQDGYVATNTDGSGFVSFVAEMGLPLSGCRVALLGRGGAVRGIAPALIAAGAEVAVDARWGPAGSRSRAFEGCRLLRFGSEEAIAFRRTAGLVVNATPLGAKPDEPLPCLPEELDAKPVCVDLRYTESADRWLTAVAPRARLAVNGLGLLVHQAAHSLSFWLQVTPPVGTPPEAVAWRPTLLETNPGEGGEIVSP